MYVVFRRLIAIFLTLSTVLSVVSPDRIEIEEFSVDSENMSILFSDVESSDPSAQHDHESGHSCHLGHCSFTLEYFADLNFISPNKSLISKLFGFEASSFPEEIIRPPIS